MSGMASVLHLHKSPPGPRGERGRQTSHQRTASTSPAPGAQNLCKRQWLRRLRSVKERSVSAPVHSISCTLVLAQPNHTPVREGGPWRHRAREHSTDLNLSLLSPCLHSTMGRILTDATTSDLLESQTTTVWRPSVLPGVPCRVSVQLTLEQLSLPTNFTNHLHHLKQFYYILIIVTIELPRNYLLYECDSFPHPTLPHHQMGAPAKTSPQPQGIKKLSNLG